MEPAKRRKVQANVWLKPLEWRKTPPDLTLSANGTS
jgi:hypothetical protein